MAHTANRPERVNAIPALPRNLQFVQTVIREYAHLKMREVYKADFLSGLRRWKGFVKISKGLADALAREQSMATPEM
jgi:hypothetical protein